MRAALDATTLLPMPASVCLCVCVVVVTDELSVAQKEATELFLLDLIFDLSD